MQDPLRGSFRGDRDSMNALHEAALHAASRRHPTIGTEDLLIGALHQKDNAATRYPESRGLAADELMARYLQIFRNAQAQHIPAATRTTVTTTPTAPAAGAVPISASGLTPGAERVLATAASLTAPGSPVRLDHLIAALLTDQSVARGLALGMGYTIEVLEAMAQECQRIADGPHTDRP